LSASADTTADFVIIFAIDRPPSRGVWG
jgi:hypothetical protein